MRGFIVPHINTLRGSSWTVGHVADLRCKQQAFSEDLGHCISVCLWLCGGEGDLWINPEFPRLTPRLLFSWGQLPGTRTKPRSCTSPWSLPSTHVLCAAGKITRLHHQQNQFKVICREMRQGLAATIYRNNQMLMCERGSCWCFNSSFKGSLVIRYSAW